MILRLPVRRQDSFRPIFRRPSDAVQKVFSQLTQFTKGFQWILRHGRYQWSTGGIPRDIEYFTKLGPCRQNQVPSPQRLQPWMVINDKAVRIGSLSRSLPGRLNPYRRCCEQLRVDLWEAYAHDHKFYDPQIMEGGCRVSWYGSLEELELTHLSCDWTVKS